MAIVINNYYGDSQQTIDLLTNIQNQNLQIMATIQEITAKVDQLQISLDNEQAAITAAISGLQQTITDLQASIVSGGTAAERQAVLYKLTAITADLESTIA